MKIVRCKSLFSLAVAMGMLFGSRWASAGNLPSWGGAATTNQAQPVQQPTEPLVTQPAAVPAQTVKRPQPGRWIAPATTSSPAVSTPLQQPRSFQLKPGTTSVKPATEQSPPAPTTFNATRAQQTVTPVSCSMIVSPTVLNYSVNGQGEVSGDQMVEVNLQTVPATSTNRSCDPWMTDVVFYYHFTYPAGTVGGSSMRRQFASIDLQDGQRCNFNVNASLQLFNGNNDVIRDIACNTDNPRYPKPTKITLQSSVREITVVTQITGTSPQGDPETITNAVSGWHSKGVVAIPINFLCDGAP